MKLQMEKARFPMRILYWTPLFWPDIGGIETLAMNALPDLKKRDYKIAVITSQGKQKRPARSHFKGISIYRFPILEALSTNNLALIKRVSDDIDRLYRKFQPDLVQINVGVPSYVYFHSKSVFASSLPLVLTLQLSLKGVNAQRNTLLGKIFSDADRIVAASAAVAKDAIGLSPAIRSKLKIIHNSLKTVPAKPPAFVQRNQNFLCVGRLTPEKGFDVAIRAFALTRQKFPKAQLRIVGQGPAFGELKKLAARLGLKKSVVFKGWLRPERIQNEIAKSIALVQPSRYREAFGLVLLEASSMARPAIATRTGGMPEIIVHGKTGFLVPMDDVKQLALAMERLLNNPRSAEKMGKAGWQRARSKFGWKSYLDSYDSLYQSLRPLVSVIIPVYNGEKYIEATLRSVLAQTHTPLEILVIDDGSTDRTADIVKKFPNVRYVALSHGGFGKALNHGFKLATGYYIAELDSDDIWVNNKIELQLAALKKDTALDLVFGHVTQFRSPDLSAKAKREIVCPTKPAPGVSLGTMLIRKNSFKKVGPFPSGLSIGHFMGWYMRAVELKLKSRMLSEVVMKRRLHKRNLGLVKKGSRIDFARVIKASLDRRRSS